MISAHVGRNDACPCGSGKKYKKCCLLRQPSEPTRTALAARQQLSNARSRLTSAPPEPSPYMTPPSEVVEDGPGKVIGTTLEHPFYVFGRGWTPLHAIHAGEWIRSEQGWVQVTKIEDTGRDEKVYNLRIEDYHTYFVGARDWGFSVWAHNGMSLS